MYSVKFSRDAGKIVEKVSKSDRKLYQRFLNAFDVIAEDPHCGKLLVGNYQGKRSYRMGSYRIIYEVRNQQLLIIVVDLGHRSGVYN